MPECCTSILNLGCYQSCDIVEIGVLASQTGEYIIELQPQGTQIFKTTNTAGSPLIFSNGFNEDGISIFKIKQPNGIYLTVSGNDCFQIENSPAKNPALADVDIEPVTCADATVRNSDSSYTATVASGGILVLPDTTYNVFIGGVLNQSLTIPTLKTETVNIYP